MSTERLAELGRLFKKYFPNTPLATYARVDDLNRKTVEEMQYLRDFGWDDLVIGIESGDDDVLRHVNKATPLPIFWRAAAVWSRQACATA